MEPDHRGSWQPLLWVWAEDQQHQYLWPHQEPPKKGRRLGLPGPADLAFQLAPQRMRKKFKKCYITSQASILQTVEAIDG